MSFDPIVLLQLTASGICLAGVYALLGVSWAVVFNTTRVFHVAHGVTLAVGGYLTVQIANDAGLSPLISLLASAAAGAAFGILIQLLVYEPLQRRGISGMGTFVASLGVLLACSAGLSAYYGANPWILSGLSMYGAHDIGPVRLLDGQIVGGAVGAAVVVVFLLLWRLTWFGRTLRAVVSSPQTAAAVGISIRQQHLIAMAVGGALGGLSGGLLSLTQGASVNSALTGILLAAIALLVGGIGSVPGAAVGGVLLALAMNIGIWPVSSKWQYTIAFGVLMVFLLVRPRGLFGERLAQADL